MSGGLDSCLKHPLICLPITPSNFKDFNAVCDALPLVMKEQTPKARTPAAFMWPNYSCYPYVVSEDGCETRPFTIDWKRSGNDEIVRTFKKWIFRRRNEIKKIGIKFSHRQIDRDDPPPCRGGDKDVYSHLYKLAIMRVLNVCPFDDVFRLYPKAWKQWLEKELKGDQKLRENIASYIKYGKSVREEIPKNQTFSVYRILVERRREMARAKFRKLFSFERTKNPLHWNLVP